MKKLFVLALSALMVMSVSAQEAKKEFKGERKAQLERKEFKGERREKEREHSRECFFYAILQSFVDKIDFLFAYMK